MSNFLELINGALEVKAETSYTLTKVMEIVEDVKKEHNDAKVAVTPIMPCKGIQSNCEIRFSGCDLVLIVNTHRAGVGSNFCQTFVHDHFKKEQAFPADLGYVEDTNDGNLLFPEPAHFKNHLKTIFDAWA